MKIEFLDGENAGQVLDVPRKRLRVVWAEVDAYDRLMSNWERISGYELTDAECDAATRVFNLVIPEEVAEWTWNPVRYGYAIRDQAALEGIARVRTATLLADVDRFEHDGAVWASPLGTLRFAEAAAHANPIPVLAWVHEHELECRQFAKRGRSAAEFGNDTGTTPEWEYAYYIARHRPMHELLRQWCGHRAVTFHERLMAAEQEIQRLDALLADTVDALRGADRAAHADRLEEEQERNRVTPYNIRPTVERPIHPSEIRERIVYRRAWW